MYLKPIWLRVRFLWVVLVLCAGCYVNPVTLPPPVQPPEPSGTLLNSEFRIGITPNYPPLAFKFRGELVGMEVDFARQLGKELNKHITFVETPWSEMIPPLVEGRIDIIMSSAAGIGGCEVWDSVLRMAGGLFVTLLVAALMLPGLSSAAETTGPGVADEESAAVQPRAPVTLDGVTLFRVVGVSAYPAEQRAHSISSRIKAAAADAAVSTTNLRVVNLPDRSNILVGDRILLSLVDADAFAEGVSRQMLAEVVRERIASAI